MSTNTPTHPLLRRRVVLCADFDQTLTVKDTIALLSQCATARQHSAHARAAHEAHVQRIVAQYMSEMNAFFAEFRKSSMRNSTTTSASTALNTTSNASRARVFIGVRDIDTDDSGDGPRFDVPGLRTFLDGYAAVDLQSITRVVDSKMLQGIHKQDLLEKANEIELMPGGLDVLAVADASYVISSNWSSAMLDATLNFDSSRRRIKIITNDLEMDAATGVTTGAIQLRVQSPGDKAQWVERIRKDEALLSSAHNDSNRQLEKEQRQEPLVVFVGDSTNDLLAMVEADVGVALVTSKGSPFVKLVNQFGAKLEPISSRKSLAECARDSEEAKIQGRQLLFTASSWAEIGVCAFVST